MIFEKDGLALDDDFVDLLEFDGFDEGGKFDLRLICEILVEEIAAGEEAYSCQNLFAIFIDEGFYARYHN